MAGDHREPLGLAREDAVDLGYALDFHILLRAIDETMPSDAILRLEGDATAPPIARFLREHAADDARELAAGSAGHAVTFHLPLAGDNLARLRLLAEDHAAPEVAFHLAVYRGDEVLLWARDAGYGSLLLARSLPPETVEEMRSALGGTLRPYVRHSFFGLFRRRNQ